MESILSILTPKKATYYLLDDSTIRQALEKFDTHKFSIVPIIDKGGKYVGTISEGDILRFIKNSTNFDVSIAENVLITQIDRYRSYKALKINNSLQTIFIYSLNQNFIPIVDDTNTYIGIIKRSDILKKIQKEIDWNK